MMLRVLRALFALLLCSSVLACGASGPREAESAIDALRRSARGSSDPDVVGRWMLGELLLPGGATKSVTSARKRLDELSDEGGERALYAALARAVDDEAHGRFQRAADGYLQALSAARVSPSPDAPLIGWFASNHLLRLRSSVHGLWERAGPTVEKAIAEPGHIGWRARGELVEWWTVDGLDMDRRHGRSGESEESTLDISSKRFGCARHARMAGPFGHGAATDLMKHFDAERPGPWPYQFERDPRRLEVPRVLEVRRTGCTFRPDEPVGRGVFYVETFVQLPAAREVLVAVQGASSVLVDDVEVLTRHGGVWGVWPRFGALMRLEAGRHRIVARLGGRETSIRLMRPDGTPLQVETSDEPAAPYSVTPPRMLPDPNVLSPFMTALGVAPQPGTPPMHDPPNTSDPLARYLAAYLAHIEGQDDMSSLLMEPLVKQPTKATGPALAMQAVYLDGDPVFPPGDARDLAKDLRSKAAEKDPALWWPQLWLALDAADKRGMAEVVPQVAELADRFREVPDIIMGLAGMYAQLGWTAEHAKTVKEAARRFPDDIEALEALLGVLDGEGQIAEADRVVARIRKLNPSEEIDLQRALARRDYPTAIAELERLKDLGADPDDVAARVADLLRRSGKASDRLEKLTRALQSDPQDAEARLELADAQYAAGDATALQRSLVDAIQTGSDTGRLRDAIELVEGESELSPFRMDGKAVIRKFDAEAPRGAVPEAPPGAAPAGNASRVLDYAVLWIHEDGAARMLEHEIIHMQSREAIVEHAEQNIPRGMVLTLRTVKKDGRVFEPEFVQGKPTVTMPHLEVGDYVETEYIYTLAGDGEGGRRFRGPRWFFREEKLAYWRSEFVTVSPKSRKLDIEITGRVPEPIRTDDGALVTHRWRVDRSPALPEEPGSAPVQEFLPSVRIGWGVSLEDTILELVDAAADLTPRDPRLVRIAQSIAASGGDDEGRVKLTGPLTDAKRDAILAKLSVDEKARRIYRWVLANVEPGRERDGRRIVVGKSGNPTDAFVYLCRLLDIEVEVGLVRNRLQPPPRGPMAEAESYSSLAVRVQGEEGWARWMTVGDKFAPYGYLPSALRGQPAIVLVEGAPRESTPAGGGIDGVTHRGTVKLSKDGSAEIELEQVYEGKMAIALRTALENLPEARLKDTVEARLLPQSLPGARLRDIEIKHLEDLDSPLVLAMTLDQSSFARPRGDELVLAPPFSLNLGKLASLPTRETPLYLGEAIATRVAVDLDVVLPDGASVVGELEPVALENDGRKVTVTDELEGPGKLHISRVIDLPAGRVQPEQYAVFAEFATKGDAAIHRPIVIRVR